MARATNDMYSRGTIITPQFAQTDSLAYLNGRPMIIVSNVDPFHSVTCVGCTTQDRPGIVVSIYDYYNATWLNGHQHTIACPYRLHEVPVRNIRGYHGVVNPITMKAISDAMAWHLGIYDTPPKYMEAILEEEYEPVYNMGTSANVPPAEIRQMCSLQENNRRFKPMVAPDYTLPGIYTHPSDDSAEPEESADVLPEGISDEVREFIEFDPIKSISEWVESELTYDPNGVTPVFILHKAYLTHSNAEMSSIAFSQRLGKIMKTMMPSATRISLTTGEYIGKKAFVGVTFKSPTVIDPTAYRKEIFDVLTVPERTSILIRQTHAGQMLNDVKLTTEDLTWLTRRILDSLGYNNKSFTTDLVRKIEDQGFHWNFIDSDKVIALMLYGDWEQIKPSAFTKIEARFRFLINQNHLDFSDLRNWPKIPNGKELKALTSGGGGKIHYLPANTALSR